MPSSKTSNTKTEEQGKVETNTIQKQRTHFVIINPWNFQVRERVTRTVSGGGFPSFDAKGNSSRTPSLEETGTAVDFRVSTVPGMYDNRKTNAVVCAYRRKYEAPSQQSLHGIDSFRILFVHPQPKISEVVCFVADKVRLRILRTYFLEQRGELFSLGYTVLDGIAEALDLPRTSVECVCMSRIVHDRVVTEHL